MAICKDKEGDCFSKCTFFNNKITRHAKKQKNKAYRKEQRNFQKPSLKLHKYWIYLDEDFKIPVLKIFEELKEKKDKEVLEIRDTMYYNKNIKKL